MSVSLTLKKCTSERNRMVKSFVAEVDIQLTGTFKEGQSLLSPSFTIESSSNLSEYNYCVITEFGRSYFMKVESVQTNIWRLNLEVDALSSFSAEIVNCLGIAKRTAAPEMINYYMNDGALYTEQREVITYHHFIRNNAEATLGDDDYMYLLVAGG